jgi:hypothetical protein
MKPWALALISTPLLLALVSCGGDTPEESPELSQAEALEYYVQWMCDDPRAQSAQLTDAKSLQATYQDGTWTFAYRGPWYVFYRGPVIKASMSERNMVVVPDSPTDEAQAASRCRAFTG